MGTLAEFRTKYPDYDDMSDQDLAAALHKKHYSDIPFDDYAKEIQFQTKPSYDDIPTPPAGTIPERWQSNQQTTQTNQDFTPPTAAPMGAPAEGIGNRQPIDAVTGRPVGQQPIPIGIPEFDNQEFVPIAPPPQIEPSNRTGAAQEAANEKEWAVIGGVIKRIPESAKAIMSSGVQAIMESPIGDSIAGFQKGLGMLSGMPGGGSATMDELSEGAGRAAGEQAHQEWRAIQNRMTELRDEATQGNPVSEYLYDVGSVVTDMGMAIGTGLITGNPGIVIPLMGGQAATGTYAGRREAGEQPGMAAISSGVTGGIEALTELIPVGFLFAKTGALEKILKVTVGEGLQESFSSIFQSLWDSKTITPDMTFQQALDSAIHEFTIGAGAGATISTAMATYESATGETAKNAAFKELLNEVAAGYMGDENLEVIDALDPKKGEGGASVTPEHEVIEGISLQESGVEKLSEPQTDQREQVSINPMDERRTGDRRVDTQLRGKVAEMTPEEQYQAIYVDRMTGLHNRRAFEDLPWRPYLASYDVDSLKWVNDEMSPDTGDQMLREVGKVMAEVIGDSDVLDAYHLSGDEYYGQADTEQELKDFSTEVNKILETRELIHEGKGISLKGIKVTWGIATHKDLADQLMKDEKKAKEAAGERAGRGEAPPGVTLTEPAKPVEEPAAEEPPAIPEVEPAEQDISKLTADDLKAKTVPEIRAIQREIGLPAKGKKSVAIEEVLGEIARVKAIKTAEKRSKAAKQRESISPADNMETAIQKLGGLLFIEADNNNIDWNKPNPGIGPLVRSEKSGEGDSMDGLSRRLQDAGFDVDTRRLSEWFQSGEISNQYTPEGLDSRMEQEAKNREQDIRDQAAADEERQEITDLAILIDRIVTSLGEDSLERISIKAHENAETAQDVENNFRRIAYEELENKQEGGTGESVAPESAETDLAGPVDAEEQARKDKEIADQAAEDKKKQAAEDYTPEDGDMLGSPTLEPDFAGIPGFDEAPTAEIKEFNPGEVKIGDKVKVVAIGIWGEGTVVRMGKTEANKTLNIPAQDTYFVDIEGQEEVELYLDELAPPDGVVESRPASTVAMQAGDTYAGFINIPYVPAEERPDLSDPPLRREDILQPFLKALGINLYEGGIKKGGVLGYYRPKGWETRVKNMSDMEVTAHELAHHIDDKYFDGFTKASNRPWIKGQGSKTFAKELKGLSYDETKVYEGFAEFVRHWMTNPAVLAERAPNFLKWFQNYVENHELGDNIKAAQAGMTSWFNQPLIQQARSKTGRHVLLNGVKDSIWDEFRQSHIDRTHGIQLMETDLTGEKAAIKGGPTETARLAAAAYSIVDRSLELGYPVVQPDGSFSFEGKGLVEILKPAAAQTEEWSLYAIGRSANELKSQGRENLFTRGQIDAMMDLETPEFKKVFDEWLEYTNGVVTFAVDMGLLSRDQVDGWRRDQFLPFYRVSRAKSESWSGKLSRKIFGEGGQGVGKRGSIPGQVTVIKMLTGGTENLGDIYQNMVMNTSMLIVESIKNDARRHAVATAQRMQGGRNWITARPKGQKPVNIEREQVADAILKPLGMTYQQYQKALEMGSVEPDTAIFIDAILAGLDEYEQFWLRGQAPNDPNVIAVKTEGKTSFYQVNDPILFRSLIAFDPPQKPIVNRVLSAVRRVMQGTVTLSLTFMGKNLWRDTQSGFVYTKSGFRPVVDSLRGMKHRISKDEVYRMAMANGMGMSSYLIDEGTLQTHIQKNHSKKGFTKRYLLNTPSNMLYYLESMADAFEMSTRLGEFERAIKRGEHPRHSAYLGREVSTDFARRGDSQISGFLFDSVAFLNAGVQGLDRGYRGLTKDDQRKQVFYRISTIATIGSILYALNRDNPCYEELEDWDRDSNWHFWVGGGGCSEKIHFTLTKPWEIGAVASMAERMVEEMIITPLEGEFPDIPDMGRHIARIFIEQLKMDWVPGMIEPLYEVYSKNMNRYFESPIVSQSMKGEPYTQYRHGTPRVLVEFADTLKEYDPGYQFSPVRAEALIRGYFNSWGAFAMMTADNLLYKDKKPEMSWTEYPVIRAWARQGPKRTRYESEYYDLYKEGAELQATINWAMKRGMEENTEVAMEKMEEKNLSAANLLRSNISSIKAAIDMVYNDPDISSADKRAQINELRVEQNAMFKEFIVEYRDLVEPK